jgi:hypothetical protein
MKIIISESQFVDFVLQYLDENYGNLNGIPIIDDFGNDDECAYEYYRHDYTDEETVFRWYDKCYWNIEGGVPETLIMWEKSPIVIFEYSKEFEKLESYFGERWKPIFADWFEKTYGNKVKTIQF